MSTESPEIAEVAPDEPESPFGRVVPLLMDSYKRNKGRTLDPEQVAAACEGMLSMSNTIQMATEYVTGMEALVFKMGEALGMTAEEAYDVLAQLQQGVSVEEINIRKRRIWTPK